jgi:hypothetical protein
MATAKKRSTPGKARQTRTQSPKSGKAVNLTPVFSALMGLFAPFEKSLVLKTAKSGYSYLESRTPTYKNRPMFFAGVREGKNYVSYHLMPVAGCRELLDGMSPELRKRMQGKACFNFTEVDERLFKELASLTQAGYEKFKSLKYL